MRQKQRGIKEKIAVSRGFLVLHGSPLLLTPLVTKVLFGRSSTTIRQEAPSSSGRGLRQAGGEGSIPALAGVASKLVPVVGVYEPERVEWGESMAEGVTEVESSNMIDSFDTIVKDGVTTDEATAKAVESAVEDRVNSWGINITNVDESTIESKIAAKARSGHESTNEATLEPKAVVEVGSSQESVCGAIVAIDPEVAIEEAIGINVEVATDKEGEDDSDAEEGVLRAEEVDDKDVEDLDFYLRGPNGTSASYALTAMGPEGVTPQTPGLVILTVNYLERASRIVVQRQSSY
ncbi:hypothetical protein ACLOJK_015912 [Asimina triloba]